MSLPALALTFFLFAQTTDGDAPQLEWKEPEAQAQFDQAKEQFEAGKYKDAAKAFASLKKQAKNKEAKTEIARFRRACEGGVKLAVYKKKATGKRKYKTYLDADKAFPKYQNTPIERDYKLWLLELKKELFTVVENFDRASSRYSEDKGKFFIDDPEWVKQGKQSLKWEVKGENISLKVKKSKLPDDFSKYRAISLWVCFPHKGAAFTLVFKCEGKSTHQVSMLNNAYFKTVSAHKGWKRIEVQFTDFATQGKADWSKIKDFRIEFNGAPNITMYIDEISMVKK